MYAATAKVHCERSDAARANFTVIVLEHICTFRCACTEDSNALAHARSETLLSQRRFAHSEPLLSQRTLAAKVRVRSQRRLESTRTFNRTRSFAATIVEASIYPGGSKLRYTRSFSYFRRNRSTVLASLTACRRVGDETRGSL